MADIRQKYASNVAGRFFVDQQCIACDACVMEAPNFFAMDDVQGHAYVKKQPQKPEEIEQCLNALQGCPVEAIGEDQDFILMIK